MILIAAFRQEEQIVGPDLVAVRLQILGTVGMLTRSNLGLIALRVPYDGYSIAVLDPIIDVEASAVSRRSGLLVHPTNSGDRVVWVRMVSGRLVDTGNAYAHDGRATGITGRLPCARCKIHTGTGALFSSWSTRECRLSQDFLPSFEPEVADRETAQLLSRWSWHVRIARQCVSLHRSDIVY